jgi:hypothetical protein
MTGDGTMAKVAGPSTTRSKVLKVGILRGRAIALGGKD